MAAGTGIGLDLLSFDLNAGVAEPNYFWSHCHYSPSRNVDGDYDHFESYSDNFLSVEDNNLPGRWD